MHFHWQNLSFALMIKNGSFPISIENLGPYEFLIFTVENIFDVTINNNFSMTNG